MRILLSPDKFKGSLSAVQACEAIARGLRRVFATNDDCFDRLDLAKVRYAANKLRKALSKTPLWLKAPGGEDTTLSEAQWLTVRTSEFKRVHGDWEALAHGEWLRKAMPVDRLTGDEFRAALATKNIPDAVSESWAARHGGIVCHPILGSVVLDRRAVKDSHHGFMSPLKAAAYAAVPNLITLGRIVAAHGNWKGRGYSTYVLAGPVNVADERHVMLAIIHGRADSHRFYLHHIEIERALQSEAKSAASATLQGEVELHRTADEGPRDLLRRLYKVNREDLHLKLDANDEPVLASHSHLTLCPIADGGEGTTEALVTALHAEWITITVKDAIGRPIEVRYGLTSDGTAVMEMSAASGLAKVTDMPLIPESASTFGTGQMILDAIQRGAKKVIIGIGGSATNDGGIGMAQALGYEFLDARGFEVTDVPAHFDVVQSIVPTTLTMPEVLVACDVDNPLLGPHGATRVYGGQKGVTDFELMEHRLWWLDKLVTRDLHVAHADTPGAGAAGGLGFGLMSFCGGRLVNGFDLIAEVLDLESRIAQSDLVITGEGRLDVQTLHGKGPAGVAAMARKHGKRVIAIAGAVDESPAVRALFDHAFAVKPVEMPLAEAMRRGAELIEETVVQHAAVFRGLGL